MRLHYTPGSPFARIIRVLVRELALDCEEVAIVAFPPPKDYFAINPLGQVPALETADGVRFPTWLIIDYLLGLPRSEEAQVWPSVRRSKECWQDEQVVAVLLATGDALAAAKYQAWAGLEPTGNNLIGFNPADRNMKRARQAFAWLDSIATPSGFMPGTLCVQDIALACIVLWLEARGGGLPLRELPKLAAIVKRCAERPSFQATKPQPWP